MSARTGSHGKTQALVLGAGWVLVDRDRDTSTVSYSNVKKKRDVARHGYARRWSRRLDLGCAFSEAVPNLRLEPPEYADDIGDHRSHRAKMLDGFEYSADARRA